jgi:hypothetical protein
LGSEPSAVIWSLRVEDLLPIIETPPLWSPAAAEQAKTARRKQLACERQRKARSMGRARPSAGAPTRQEAVQAALEAVQEARHAKVRHA